MRLKAFLWLVFLFAVAQGAWAEQVTEEQAQQQAQKFLTNLSPTSGVRHAPGTMPQFTTIRQVSGLYVFNLDGGFVIVSNDDRTIPVLGYGAGDVLSSVAKGSDESHPRIHHLDQFHRFDRRPARHNLRLGKHEGQLQRE